MTIRTASCACGQLKVTCQGEPQMVALCHCLECQRRTGSTYGIAAFFPRVQTGVQGRASTYGRSSASGFNVAFHFCPHCGSTVYWEPRRKPEMVAVGAFGDPGFPAPTQSAWTERRHPWVVTPN
jgi:hypothetical protein